MQRRNALLRVGLILFLVSISFLPLVDRVGVTPARAAAIGLTNASPTYTQNFNTLATTGTANTWTDDSTISGWYSNRTSYRADSGTSNTGALYSYGTSTASTNRGLGSVASGGTGTVIYGARFVNSGTTPITSLAISYTGQQWRNGGNTAAQSITFSYQVGAASLTGGTYTGVAALDFTSPTTGATAAAINPPSTASVSGTVTASVGVGQEIWIRWDDPNDAGNDHGLAIDDLTVTATFSAAVAPQVSTTTPANGATGVAVNANIDITFNRTVNVSGNWFQITCSSSGTRNVADTAVTGGPTTFTIDPTVDFTQGESCTVTVYAAQVVDQGTSTPMAANYTFSFTVFLAAGACPAVPLASPLVTIGAIQGNGATSPLAGQTRTIRGRVIGDFQNVPATTPAQMGGFFVQNAPGGTDGLPDAAADTSDGIFVFSTTAVSVGDAVQVTGTVVEFGPGTLKETQLNTVTVTKCGNVGTVTPTAITLPLPSGQSFEQYEGMLVTFSQPLYVVEHFQLGRFGAFRVADQVLFNYTHTSAPSTPGYTAWVDLMSRRSFTIDDGSSVENPDPIIYPSPALTAMNTVRGGDTVSNVIGVFRQTYGAVTNTNGTSLDYRLAPVPALTAANFTQSNPRPTTPPTVPGKLKVGGFNVLNYFTDLDIGCTFTIPGATGTQCRGADSAQEFTRQRTKTIAAICAMNLDIVGITELENNPANPNSAIDDLIAGVNGTAGCGPYTYIDTGILGTDAIRVAIIYKPAVVSTVGNFAKLDNVFPFNVNTRPPLAQTFKFGNEVFTFVVNHFKSKSTSGCPTSGTNADNADGQSCWTGDRVAAANAVVAWLATNPTGTTDPDVLMVGDYNSYAQEDPVKALAAGGFVNISEKLLGASAYSYRFDAQLGYLDYAFANASMLTSVSGIAEWHINADEPSVLDYNTEFKSAGQVTSLYSPLPFRTSDHDPVIVGLFETNVTWPNISTFDPAVSKLGVLSEGGVGLPGERLTWTITVTNNGGVAGSNVVVTDTLRPELRVDSADAGKGTFTINGQTVTFTIPTLNPNETVTLHVVTTVLARPSDNQFVNDVTLVGSGAQRSAQGVVSLVTSLPATGYAPAQSDSTAAPLLFVGIALLLVGLVTIRLRKR